MPQTIPKLLRMLLDSDNHYVQEEIRRHMKEHVDAWLPGCPVCGSVRLVIDDFDYDQDRAHAIPNMAALAMRCMDCNSSWSVIFRPTRMENLMLYGEPWKGEDR
jgi:hypothetical protein